MPSTTHRRTGEIWDCFRKANSPCRELLIMRIALCAREQLLWNYRQRGVAYAPTSPRSAPEVKPQPKNKTARRQRDLGRDHSERSWMCLSINAFLSPRSQTPTRTRQATTSFIIKFAFCSVDECARPTEWLKSHLKQKLRRSAYFILNVDNYSDMKSHGFWLVNESQTSILLTHLRLALPIYAR